MEWWICPCASGHRPFPTAYILHSAPPGQQRRTGLDKARHKGEMTGIFLANLNLDTSMMAFSIPPSFVTLQPRPRSPCVPRDGGPFSFVRDIPVMYHAWPACA